jgi:hypothetical protein
MRAPRTADLAQAPAECAERLEAAIAKLGEAYRDYAHATRVLEAAVQQDLARYLEVPIVIHVAERGGLTNFLERRLVGTPADLRALVEAQHRRNGVR